MSHAAQFFLDNICRSSPGIWIIIVERIIIISFCQKYGFLKKELENKLIFSTFGKSLFFVGARGITDQTSEIFKLTLRMDCLSLEITCVLRQNQNDSTFIEGLDLAGALDDWEVGHHLRSDARSVNSLAQSPLDPALGRPGLLWLLPHWHRPTPHRRLGISLLGLSPAAPLRDPLAAAVAAIHCRTVLGCGVCKCRQRWTTTDKMREGTKEQSNKLQSVVVQGPKTQKEANVHCLTSRMK